MNILDISYHLTSYLSNAELFTLYLFGLVPDLRSLSTNQRWWCERVRVLYPTLSQSYEHYAEQENYDWRTTHIVLSRELEKESPSLWNREDNVLATELLSIGRSDVQLDEFILDAAREGSTSLFAHFIGGSVSERTKEQCLMSAVEYGHVEIVKLCLSNKVNIGALPYALFRACQARWGNESGNYTRIVQALLPEKLESSLCKCLIMEACKYDDNVEIVKLLLSSLEMTTLDEHVLQFVVSNNRKKIASLLIEAGVQCDRCLIEAVIAGPEMLELVLGYWPQDTRMHPAYALCIAIEREDVRCVDILLSIPEVASSVRNEDILRQRRRTHHSGIIELLDSASSMH